MSNRREFLQQAAVLATISLNPGTPAAHAQMPGSPGDSGKSFLLREGWTMRSSADVSQTGPALSVPGLDVRDWYPATLPSTVLSALVRDNVYLDPYFGMNLRTIAGTEYPIDEEFANFRMPPDSPFRHSWWYRTEFKMPRDYAGSTLWLRFDGINYRANLWVNGRQAASSDKFAGMWRLFNFDVTSQIRTGEKNCVAVEVFPPQARDLAMTFVDWAPLPPDKEMGLWRDVRVRATGPVAMRYPAVFTKLNLPSTDHAQLTIRVELENAATHPVDGVLKGRIEDISFSKSIRLRPSETSVVTVDSAEYPRLNVSNPRLWWPAQVGSQELYPLDLEFETGGQTSDSSHILFGIRQVTADLDQNGHRVFQVNGKRILIRDGLVRPGRRTRPCPPFTPLRNAGLAHSLRSKLAR